MIGSPEIQPKVHTFDFIDTIKEDYVLLIVDEIGNKYKTDVKTFVSYILSNIKIPKIKIDKKEVIDAITSEDVINIGKVLNLAGNKNIERKVTKVGSIYFNGENLRLLTNKGWKSLYASD